MTVLAVFGRGPMGGLLAHAHAQQMKATPAILEDVYVVAGINPNFPVALGAVDFRWGGGGPADPTFVCLEPTCRRRLPTYVSQIDHNVPVAGLAPMNLAQPHVGPGAAISAINFVGRAATNANTHVNRVFNPPGGAPVAGAGFALYYTFTADTFSLVMQIGVNLWHTVLARAQAWQIRALIQFGFTLVPSPAPNLGCFDFHRAGGPALGPGLGRMTPTAIAYAANLNADHDLANMQFLCGPCNATKNAYGHPILQPTVY